MNKTLKWILIGLGILVVVILIAGMLKGSSKDGIKVTAEKAQRRTIIETVNASGKVYPEVEVKISPDISGEITELNVQEGDSVRKGQVLARLYADIYSSQRDEAAAGVAQSQASVANSQEALDALKAQVDQAKTNYTRNKDLYDQKVISQAEFEQYETQYRSSQSQYKAAIQNIRSLQANTQRTRTSLVAANKNLSRTTLTSPMDGVISSLSVKKGERVAGNSFNVGTEMMRVADLSSMEVRVDVGENDIVKVSIGDSADIEVEAYNNRKFKGIVYQIASSTNKTGTASLTSGDVTNYEVRIRLDPASYRDLIDPSQPKKFPFRPGMNANADIKTKRKDNIVSVPIAAVAARVRGSDKSIDEQKKEKKKTTDEDADENASAVSGNEVEEVVFVIKPDNTVEKTTVTTGIQDINNIEILTGLKGDEQIVTGPFNEVNKNLRTGKKVTVVSKDKLFSK
jgi:HlyD family secretion protein